MDLNNKDSKCLIIHCSFNARTPEVPSSYDLMWQTCYLKLADFLFEMADMQKNDHFQFNPSISHITGYVFLQL